MSNLNFLAHANCTNLVWTFYYSECCWNHGNRDFVFCSGAQDGVFDCTKQINVLHFSLIISQAFFFFSIQKVKSVCLAFLPVRSKFQHKTLSFYSFCVDYHKKPLTFKSTCWAPVKMESNSTTILLKTFMYFLRSTCCILWRSFWYSAFSSDFSEKVQNRFENFYWKQNNWNFFPKSTGLESCKNMALWAALHLFSVLFLPVLQSFPLPPSSAYNLYCSCCK